MAVKKVSYIAALAMAFLVSRSAYAQVTVRIYNAASVPYKTLDDAEQQAGYIFRAAGVPIGVVNCAAADSGKSVEKICPLTLAPDDLVVRLIPRGKSSSETFGMAFLPAEGQGRYADVFYGPVLDLRQSFSGRVPLDEGRLLGHLIAHEVGHLLLGSNSHSSGGIMAARWHTFELASLAAGKLLFTPEQSQKLRAGAQVRVAGAQKSQSPTPGSYPRSFALSQMRYVPEMK
jgi:hypothetical protein